MKAATPDSRISVTGRCHCGSVSLAAEVNPACVFVCHCADCQVLTGSAFRVVAPVVPGSLRMKGSVKGYARMADSGNLRWQYFCPECGTPLYAGSQYGAGLVTVRVGVLAERDQLPPTAQLWRRSAQSWVDELDQVPACERQALLG